MPAPIARVRRACDRIAATRARGACRRHDRPILEVAGMGSPSDNVAKLKHAYREWHDSKGGSVKTWLDLVADDVKVYSLAAGAPEVEFTAAVSSKKDFERYFTGLLADWEMIHYTTGTFITEGKPRGHARLHGLAQPE